MFASTEASPIPPETQGATPPTGGSRTPGSGDGVTVVQRPLRYPKAWPAEKAQEKGVDVALAVDFVMLAVTGVYDVGILCSTDTDLKPALEAVAALGRNRQPHCEVAAWASSQAVPRLRITGAKLWCHYLRVEDYRGMVDSSDYTTP
jgi:NYN domain-containing protein